RPSLVVEISQRAVTFQALAQRGAGYAKKLGGPDLVAVRFAHRSQRELSLKPRQQLDSGIRRRCIEERFDGILDGITATIDVRARGDLPKRDILRQEHVRGRQNGSSLNSVFQ